MLNVHKARITLPQVLLSALNVFYAHLVSIKCILELVTALHAPHVPRENTQPNWEQSQTLLVYSVDRVHTTLLQVLLSALIVFYVHLENIKLIQDEDDVSRVFTLHFSK